MAQKNFPCLILLCVCLDVKVSKELTYQYIPCAKSMIRDSVGMKWLSVKHSGGG